MAGEGHSRREHLKARTKTKIKTEYRDGFYNRLARIDWHGRGRGSGGEEARERVIGRKTTAPVRAKGGRGDHERAGEAVRRLTNPPKQSGTAPPPPLEWMSSPPLVASAFISPNGAESPGSGRMRVICPLLYFFSI